MPLMEIKDFNAEINNTIKQDYTTGNVLDYLYHQKQYKHIGINFPKQIDTSIPQKIKFTKRLEKYKGAIMFFIAED